MLQRGTTTLETVTHLSDSELLDAVKSAAQSERNATARLVALLAHVDQRRLYLGEGCSSLFTYCTQVLRLSEHAAYGRIEAVRREVWTRDGGRCAFVGASGRCTERGFLEFHHVRPYADGGVTDVENLKLRCRAHNMHEASSIVDGRLQGLLREASCGTRCDSVRTG